MMDIWLVYADRNSTAAMIFKDFTCSCCIRLLNFIMEINNSNPRILVALQIFTMRNANVILSRRLTKLANKTLVIISAAAITWKSISH